MQQSASVPQEPVAVIVATPTGTIDYWSPGAATLFGYTRDEALGARLDLIVPVEYRERHWAGFTHAIQTGQGRLDGATANVPVLCKDGQVLAFPGRFGLVRDGHNRVVGALAVFSAREGNEQPWTPTWQASPAGA